MESADDETLVPAAGWEPQRPPLLELACVCMCSQALEPHYHPVHGNSIEPGWQDLKVSDDGGVGIAGTDIEITPRPPQPLFSDSERPHNTITIGRVRREWEPVTEAEHIADLDD